LLTVVLTIPATVAAQELRYKFRPGGSTAYTAEQKQTMKVTARGQELDMKVNSVLDFTLTIDSVDGKSGAAKVKYKFDRIRMSLQGSPGDDFEFDTKSEQPSKGSVVARVAPVFQAVVGAEITATVSTRGEVHDVVLPDKLKEQFQKQSGAGSSLNGLFTEDQLQQLLKDPVPVLPQEAVKPGTAWPITTELKMGPLGKKKITAHCTYAGKEGALEKIDQKLDVRFEAGPDADVDFTVKTKEATGKIQFDNQKGRVVEATSRTISEMEIAALGTVSMTETTSLKVKQ